MVHLEVHLDSPSELRLVHRVTLSAEQEIAIWVSPNGLSRDRTAMRQADVEPRLDYSRPLILDERRS